MQWEPVVLQFLRLVEVVAVFFAGRSLQRAQMQAEEARRDADTAKGFQQSYQRYIGLPAAELAERLRVRIEQRKSV